MTYCYYMSYCYSGTSCVVFCLFRKPFSPRHHQPGAGPRWALPWGHWSQMELSGTVCVQHGAALASAHGEPLASTWARAPYGPALIGIPVKLLTYQLNVYLLILSDVIISLLTGSGSFGVTEIPILV